MTTKRLALILATALLVPSLALAAVTQLVIESSALEFDGRKFAGVGAYERLSGYAVGELDPADARNAAIVDIDKAPRNANGRVDYRVDVQILKPVNLSRGNGWMLYEVVNRGRQLVFGRVNAGTDFLMRRGFTLVWSGWQGDIASGGATIGTQFPVATDDGAPIVGLSREEFISTSTAPGFFGNLVYPAANLDPSQATLTVRENEQDPRQSPVGLAWEYVNPRRIHITRPSSPAFDRGAIYEFIYPAMNPIVMGIGFAATRDVNSFLRYDTSSANPLVMDGRPLLDHFMALGVSQSGRFLKDLIYLGFNQDEAGRIVFDGAVPIIAGSRKTFTNYRFAQPGRYSRQHEDHVYPGDQFPFTYATLTDPLTGRTDSILAQCEATGTCPKIMHFDSDTEIWQARGSLVVTDGHPSAPADIQLAPNARAYLATGTQHGPAAAPSFGICQQLSNPLEYAPILRAVIVALQDWVAAGIEPPATRYGSVAEGTLVPRDQASSGFPAIPGVTYNGLLNGLAVMDHSFMPPVAGPLYGVLVSRFDVDGNGLAGVRHPLQEVASATHAGWNLRAEGHAVDELCSLTGSYIPFAQSAADRSASGDPRLSMEERYSTHGDYVSRVANSAARLVQDRLLLPEDAARIVRDAAQGSIGK